MGAILGPVFNASEEPSIQFYDHLILGLRLMDCLQTHLFGVSASSEDGTHIVHPDRYEALSRRGQLSSHFIPASRGFQVICIGVSVPPFIGYPLDPPFRSRFQVHYIDPIGASLALAHPHPSHPLWIQFKELVMTIQLANESKTSPVLSSPLLPNFPLPTLARLKALLKLFPTTIPLQPEELTRLVGLLHPRLPHLSTRARELLSAHLERAGLGTLLSPPAVELDGGGLFGYRLVRLDRLSPHRARAHYVSTRLSSDSTVECDVRCGSEPLVPVSQLWIRLTSENFLLGARFEHIFNVMSQVHAIDADIVLLPMAGAQPSASTALLIQCFSRVFGYGPQPRERIHLYREMTGKELVMRRTADGGWTPSRLVEGAMAGALVELAAVDVIGPSISAISRLLDSRALEMWGERRLVAEQVVGDPLASVVGGGFRVIATATKAGMDSEGSGRVPEWMLNDELSNVSMMVGMVPLSWEEEVELLRRTSVDGTVLHQLAKFVKAYRNLSAGGRGRLRRLGTRSLLRICRRLATFPDEQAELARILRRALLVDFLPRTERIDFESCVEGSGLEQAPEWVSELPFVSASNKTQVNSCLFRPMLRLPFRMIKPISFFQWPIQCY